MRNKNCSICLILAIVGAIALVAVAAVFLYKRLHRHVDFSFTEGYWPDDDDFNPPPLPDAESDGVPNATDNDFEK